MILRNQVLNVLKDNPESRNSDVLLTIEIWRRYYHMLIMTGASGKEAVLLDNLYKLPREDNVKRLRAEIQNEKGMYLPTEWAIAKRRKIREEIWKNYIISLKPDDGGTKTM